MATSLHSSLSSSNVSTVCPSPAVSTVIFCFSLSAQYSHHCFSIYFCSSLFFLQLFSNVVTNCPLLAPSTDIFFRSSFTITNIMMTFYYLLFLSFPWLLLFYSALFHSQCSLFHYPFSLFNFFNTLSVPWDFLFLSLSIFVE